MDRLAHQLNVNTRRRTDRRNVTSPVEKWPEPPEREVPREHLTVRGRLELHRHELRRWKQTGIKGEMWEKVGCDIWEKWVGGRNSKTQNKR